MDPRDLAHQLATEGGFSLSAAGRSARSGQMVARAGAEEVHRGIASPEQISSYQQRHAVEMKRRGYYMGGWVEGVQGNPNLRPGSPVQRKQTVLDISQRFPSGHAEAMNLQGVIHDQRAAYDVDKGDVSPINHDVLPMDYSHLDIEEIHHPKIRSASQFAGERERRTAAATEGSNSVQGELPFTSTARRRMGMP